MFKRVGPISNTGVFAALVSISFVFISQSSAVAAQDGKFTNIKIKNFGQMDERIYRGAQPAVEDYKDLAELGISTVVDLRDDPESYEKKSVEALGMRYVNIPMSDTTYPKEEQLEAFLKLVNDPQSGKLYIHCAGGRHRTGVVGAVYRYNVYHWNYDQVYKEMKDFDFYTRWGHGKMKDYVQDYWGRSQGKDIVVSTEK